MNKREFLKQFGLGSVAVGASIIGVKKINDVIPQSNKTTLELESNIPAELQFNILKDDEVFHPIHKEYKVNRSGQVSYINHHNKVFICKLNKHRVTGQLGYRLKNTNVIASRFIFESFTQTKLTQSYIIITKDGNSSNIFFDNLQCIRKKDYNGYKISETRNIIRDKNGRIITYL